MTTIALSLAAFSTLVSLICFAALIEMFKNLQELQKHVDYHDTPKPLPEATSALMGHVPSEYGLPAELDTQTAAMLLLSPRCFTCSKVAGRLAKAIPDGLTIVVTGADEKVAREWLDGVGLPADAVIFDHDYNIVNSMALYTTPSILRIIDGRIAGAWTIASYRALRSFMEQEDQTSTPPADLKIAPEIQGGHDYAATG